MRAGALGHGQWWLAIGKVRLVWYGWGSWQRGWRLWNRRERIMALEVGPLQVQFRYEWARRAAERQPFFRMPSKLGEL
jgi:hypothetical protein